MEFKKLSAVETIETASDTANVLIEENGVIKKTPKTMFKGAEITNEPDLVIVMGTLPAQATPSNISIKSGSLAQVYETASQNIMPNIKIECYDSYNGNYVFAQFDAMLYIYGSYTHVSFWAPPELNLSSSFDTLEKYEITFLDENIIDFDGFAPT